MSLSGEFSTSIKEVQGKSCILFGNIAGLYPRTNKEKVQFLAEKARANNSSIIALTESHLKSNVLDAEVNIPGYQLFRTDRRDDINKGGVITYIREDFAMGVKVLSQGDNDIVEWTCLHLPKIEVVFINIYRPPSCDECSFSDALTELSCGINSVGAPMPTIIACGDFNMPFVDWGRGSIGGATKIMQRQAEMLQEFMGNFCLRQKIQEATRKDNLLDLFLTNNQDLVCQVLVSDTVLSDHRLVLVGTYLESNLQEKPCDEAHGFSSLNFYHYSINWDEICEDLLEIDWKLDFTGKYPDDILDSINRQLYDICSRHIPLKGKRRHKSIIPRDRKIIMRKRIKLNKRLKTATGQQKISSKRELDTLEYKLLNSHRKERETRELQAIDSIKTNSKFFFVYAKKKI